MPDIADPRNSLFAEGPRAGWRWVGDRGLRVETGTQTLAYYRRLRDAGLREVQDIVPADGSLLLVLRRGAAVSDALRALLEEAPGAAVLADGGMLREVVMRYGGSAGPDLALLAEQAGLSVADWIARHAAVDYRVAFLGFQPGFPYLFGLPQALWAPRRGEPRLRVAAGSVAIGGRYCGIYPASGPGGWQIIGVAEAVLFDPARGTPALLAPGDRVRFIAA